jgi:hypothetical protein
MNGHCLINKRDAYMQPVRSAYHCLINKRDADMQPVRSAYQQPASSTFLSKQTSHQQSASSTFISEQSAQVISHQPNERADG